MKQRQRDIISIALAVVTIALLFITRGKTGPNDVPTVYLTLFTILLTYTATFGIPIGGGEVSLVPLVALSSLIVMGPFMTGLAILFSELLYALLRLVFKEKVGWTGGSGGFSLVAATTANITMHILSILAAGSVYQALDAHAPVQNLGDLLAMLAVGAAYIITNYLFASLFMWMISRAHAKFMLQNMQRMLFYEVVPLFFAPLLSTTLTKLGVVSFILLAMVLVLFAGILRDQVKAHENLERHVQELSSLQAVGETLSASLDIREISEAIYQEVAKLMPSSNFYVALYNADTNEVSFPVIYEDGEQKYWNPREAGQGLTEYIFKTKKPLLISSDVKSMVEAMGMKHYGKEAHSWLGVPILAGDDAVGMMAVQSYPADGQIPQSYDISHQEILTTIAAQASVAIQNARLYAQTDEALAQRVQELNSILSTAAEGILLLNTNLVVLEANRALANMLNTTPANILDQNLAQAETEPLKQLQIEKEVLQNLIAGEIDTHQSETTISGKSEIPVERTITPVMGETNIITGWLVVYRDLTEQLELERIKEDLMRMLVHDLRSPIVSIQGGLDMIEVMINDDDKEALLEMLEISRKGSTMVLGMINQILNLNKMESGSINLHIEPLALPTLFNEERLQFKSILKQNDISIAVSFSNESLVINADRDLLTRVIHNLLDNAIKYSKNGSEITAWGKPDPENPDYVLFGVEDNGVGIPKEIQSNLFDKYFTSQQEKARRKGTGLGLYFCKLAVEAHGGSIWVDSEPDQGSNFTIRLPIQIK